MKSLIAIRREHIVPQLTGINGHVGDAERIGATGLVVRWRLPNARLALLLNLGEAEPSPAIERPPGEALYVSAEDLAEELLHGRHARLVDRRLPRADRLMEELDALAERCGIEAGYWDIVGKWHTTSPDTKRALLAAMGVDADSRDALAAGLERVPSADTAAGLEAGCLLPAEMGIGRAWGVTCQAYGLRSRRSGGIGDLEDVARLAEVVGRQQGDFLGLNPLHALFPADPSRYSPYAPSSRRWLSLMVIAVDVAATDLGLAVPEALPAGQGEGDLIDYALVHPAKLSALRSLWRAFEAAHLAAGAPSAAGAAFTSWRAEPGPGPRAALPLRRDRAPAGCAGKSLGLVGLAGRPR